MRNSAFSHLSLGGGQGAGRSETPGHALLFAATGELLRQFDAPQAGDGFGAAVAPAGDVDGDGMIEVAVGAPFADTNAGAAGRVWQLGLEGGVRRRLDGPEANAQFGAALAGGLDANGDGVADLLVGAPLADGVAGADTGAAWLYSGDGAPLARFSGTNDGDHQGRAVLLTGDLSGDGSADIALGAPFAAGVGTYSLLLSAAPAVCPADCDDNNQVTVDELVKGVSIALGLASLTDCPSFDTTKDAEVTVDELVAAVNRALNGC